MSQTDSFIEEVTEEVRRDHLFKMVKKWGWLAALVVVVLVGGAAFNEWRKASQASAAQAFGDALVAGIEVDDDGSQLAAIVGDGPDQTAIVSNMAAAVALEKGETEFALRELEKAGALTEAEPIYRDLSNLKRALALPPDLPAEERLAAFDLLTVPGGPFRLIALEQKALISIEQGDIDAALETLRDLLQEAELTPGLQRRASELIVALGGDLAES